MIGFILANRRLIAYGLAGAALVTLLLWYRHSLIADGRQQGRAAVQALWDADKTAWLAANQKVKEDAKARVEATLRNNEQVLHETNQELLVIAADRTSLAGRLRDAQDGLRRLASRQATDQRGIDVAAGISARQREIDEAHDAYDSACRRDAVRFGKLQDEIRPQM